MSDADTVPIDCELCGARIDVPRRSRGGVANCPDCGRAIQVPGGVDLGYALIWVGGLAFAGLVGWIFWGMGAAVAIGAALVSLGLFWIGTRFL